MMLLVLLVLLVLSGESAMVFGAIQGIRVCREQSREPWENRESEGHRG